MEIVLAILAVVGILVLLAVFVGWRAKKRITDVVEFARLLPSTLLLLRDVARDPAVPRRLKVSTIVTVGYLALPFDLIPDFIPVVGQLDDVLIVGWALRRLLGTAGRETIASHWRGTDDQLATLMGMLRLR